MNKCKDDQHEYQWRPATNEDGWFCVICEDQPGEPPGFSPQLDRDRIWWKVGGILMDIEREKFISVSNGTGGDLLTSAVADRCNREGRYDQYSILLFLLEEETPGHAKYWKEVGDSVIAGQDIRDRCACGKLSTIHIFSSEGQANYCSYECKEAAGKIVPLFQ